MSTTHTHDGVDEEGRYVVDETYDGDLRIADRENEDAWIRSDVAWPLEP